MSERWRAFTDKGVTWDYEVSDRGQVRRVATGLDISPCINSYNAADAYYRVTLYRTTRRGDVIQKSYYVHRMVAIAFVGGRSWKCWQVHHIDHDKHNNHALNPEWVTPAQNIQYKLRRTQQAAALVDAPF